MYNNEDRSESNGSSLLDILSQHMRLLTMDFYKYNAPFCQQEHGKYTGGNIFASKTIIIL